MSHDPKKTVTIEDLLRIKRAERPPVEFWAQWDRELRAKQLAAIVEERPWWQVHVPVYVRRMVKWQIPVGATAVMALTFVTLRDYQDQSAQEPVLVTEEVISNATEQPGLASAAASGTTLYTVASVSTSGTAALQVEDRAEASQVTAAPSLEKTLVAIDAPIQPVEIPAAFIQSSTHDVIPATLRTEPPKEPLTRIASAKDVRRARLLDGAMGGRYGSTGNAEVARTRDRIASRLNEDRFYASDAGRLGTSGDRLSLRF